MSHRTPSTFLPLLAAALLSAPVTFAYEPSDWIIQAGIGNVDPKSDNGTIASVDDGTSLVISGEYMFSESLGFEILAALPFSHDIRLAADGTKVGEASHLPPTFSLKYHFQTEGNFDPYVGAGLNYTLFFDEETTGPLAGSSLELDPSFGIAAQAGFDVQITDRMMLNLDVRWMNIETDAKLDGVFLETVEIDPVVYGLTLGWQF